MKRKGKIILLLSLLTVLVLQSSFAAEVSRCFDATAVALSDVYNGLNQPYGIEVMDDGVIYIADTYNNMIKKLENGKLAVVAGYYEGKNSLGFPLGGLKDGDALTAAFNKPRDICVAEDGTIYVADSQNHAIRKIKDGTVTTLAGTGEAGDSVGLGRTTRFNLPTAIAMGNDGKLYVADTLNNKIKVVDVNGKSSELMLTSADNANRLNEPSDLYFDEAGALYIVDSGNQCIKKVVDGVVSIIAGGKVYALDEAGYAPQGFVDGLASLAKFNFPKGIAMDDRGNLYIADTWNNAIRVLMADNRVVTLTGGIMPGNKVGALDKAVFDAPISLDYTNGMLYITDRWNNEIKQIDINPSDAIVADEASLWYNGEKVIGDASVLIKEDIAWVPLKMAATALGYTVSWDSAVGAVVLTSGDIVEHVSQNNGLYLENGKSYVKTEDLDTLLNHTVQQIPSLKAVVILP
jgi:DNA-binding beta-propeller fold protein YncE